ncbi:MAG: alpha/beta fold hydrolase [Methylococcales bacterium]|nr:alpha/beta fold hydrolase [Methylococcales bacterium]
MKLEVIHKQPKTEIHATPLLFVHGAWHGAWCWDVYFLDYFAQHGYDVYALSLRGHGESEGRDKLRWHRAKDYVADVAQVANSLPTPPIVIGHSMGGYVVQKYLEQYDAPAGILLASVPPMGVVHTTLNIIRHHPLLFLKANLTMSLYPLIGTPELTRANFFSAGMSDDKVHHYFQKMQDEAYLAFLDMLLFNLPKPKRVNTPLLVLGAEDDTVISPDAVRATATTYGTTATFFPHTAHDLMLEANWQAVADHMLNWLSK